MLYGAEIPGANAPGRVLLAADISASVSFHKSEAEYKKAHGLEALEERFKATGFNYVDPSRDAVC